MKSLWSSKRWQWRRVRRLQFLLGLLVLASAALLVINLMDLVGLYYEYGTWQEIWQHKWRAGSGVPGVLGSSFFHVLLLLVGWAIWFRLRSREFDQTRLLRSEQKYRNIINHAGEAIFLLDQDGRVREWNKSAEKLFGAARRSVLNRPFQDIHLCYGLEVEKAMKDAASLRRSLTFEFPFPRSQNPGGQISLTISPIAAGGSGDDGKLSFAVIARDITSEKQLASKMSETEKLAGIGQLAAGIAHQLNTPLGSILLSAQMLEDTVTGEDEVEDIRRIIRQTEQCRTIIKGILNFARPSGQQRREINLADAVRETIYLLEKNLKMAGVEMDIREETASLVYGDRNELDQVFFNLLSNALDAMPDGGCITVAFRDGTPGELQIEFADTGEGIPAEQREKVFLPFFTTKEYGRGTGLGLSIVARIIHEHGGRIEMESEPGQGTRFLLALPRAGTRLVSGGRAELSAETE